MKACSKCKEQLPESQFSKGCRRCKRCDSHQLKKRDSLRKLIQRGQVDCKLISVGSQEVNETQFRPCRIVEAKKHPGLDPESGIIFFKSGAFNPPSARNSIPDPVSYRNGTILFTVVGASEKKLQYLFKRRQL